MRHCTQCGAPTPDDARFCPRCGTAVAASASDPMLGRVITDRYLLIEKIGQGGSGTIYRGEHTTLRKKVAVKILHAQLSTDDTALERFRREATTVAELDNDHILQVLDFGRTDDNRLFFAMEYLEGETLTKVLEREKKLPVPRAIDILTQIAEALMEAHGLGYVHRDLRPRNVFLINKRGRVDFVKLLDFGLAKLILPTSEAKQTAMGMTFGDPRYMSPEQARGDTLDRRSDIYSLGAIAFEMLTGAPPYSGSGTFEILQQHLDAPVPRVRERRPDCPEWLEAVVLRALSKQRDGRFLTVLKVLECLRSQMAPPVADAAEKAAHAQLSAQGPGEQAPVKAGPNTQTLVGAAAPVVSRAATAAPSVAHAPTEPNPQVNAGPGVGTAGQVRALVAAVEATPSPPSASSPAPAVVPAAGAAPGGASASAGAPVPVAAKPSPSGGNPKETQVLTTLKAASTSSPAQPTASKKPQPHPQPTQPQQPQAERKSAGPGQPANAASGSVEVTPASLRMPDAANVPSVVVESSSNEKTLPERPAPPRAAAHVEPPRDEPPLRVDTPTALPPPPEGKKQERPPTGEWFSAETRAVTDATGYDEDFDDLPRKNRAPLIIGGVIGGLGLAVIVVIALLPKPQHKPLRGEEALNQAAKPAATSPATGTATTPSGTTAATSTTPTGTSATPTGAATAPTAATGTSVAAAPAGTTATSTGASATPNVTATGAGATPTSGSATATGATPGTATPAPKIAEKPAPPPILPTPAPKVAEKPAKVEKPAVIAAPVEKPAIAEKAREKPAKLDKPEKAEKVEKTSARVASAEKPAPIDKRKKVPEGFKDPFATEPSGAKPAGEPAQAEFFIKLGRQKLNADELSAAAANFNKAREYDARSHEAIAGLGEVAFEQGDYNGAAVHLKQALKLSPNRPRYLVLLGQTYYKMGKAKEAVGEYKKALRLDPGNAEAQHSLEVAERKLNGG